LRSIETSPKEFRELIEEITMLLCYEATNNVEMKDVVITTPLEEYRTKIIDKNKITFVAILRAGLSMIDGVLKIIPTARIGHIGLCRNEKTLEPEEYYYKVPENIKDSEVFIIDPMLATGGSAIQAINKLKKEGIKKVNFLCIIASPEGIENIKKAHKDVQIYCASIDRCLNSHGYILPGLGDAGDRLYGTK
jgi:uracil phosphoribosyltransferase